MIKGVFVGISFFLAIALGMIALIGLMSIVLFSVVYYNLKRKRMTNIPIGIFVDGALDSANRYKIKRLKRKSFERD